MTKPNPEMSDKAYCPAPKIFSDVICRFEVEGKVLFRIPFTLYFIISLKGKKLALARKHFYASEANYHYILIQNLTTN